MSKITEALEKLDPANDNHWTTDGLPRIETIRMLAADQTITRDMITTEAPGFSRSTAVTPTESVAPTTESEDGVVTKEYEALIAQAREGLDVCKADVDAANEAFRKQQQVLDDLINEQQDSGAVETNADAIMGYLNSQKNLIAERGRRAQVLRDSGVTLADIQNLIPQAAPIDQALAKKR
jgi:hypothetical protein